MSAIGSSSDQQAREQAQEACRRAGCEASWGQTDGSGDTCTGTPNGCDQQGGNALWVQGPTSEDANTWNVRRNLLHCEWRQWDRCPTQQTCEASGECNDHGVGELGGCLFQPVSNKDGYAKGCDRMGYPLGCATRNDQTDEAVFDACSSQFRFDWADGSCALTQDDGSGYQRRVLNQTLCTQMGGEFKSRAESEAECTGYGKVCSSPFNSHDVYGGITTTDKCQSCGYRYQNSKTWRAGTWAAATEQPLIFAKRTYSSKNTWDLHVPDESKFRKLIMNTVATMVADAQRDKITCELEPYKALIPIVNNMCNAGAAAQAVTVASYSLAQNDVPCDDMASQAPATFYEGSVDFSTATCTDGTAVFQSANVDKTVVIESSQVRRRRLSAGGGDVGACAAHRVIKNPAGAIVGQTVGSGVAVTGVSGATVCLNPTVPADERCPEYTERDVVSVSSSGVYSAPLEATVTVDAQGKYCIGSTQAGVTYVPVHLKSDWKTVAGPPQPPSPAPASTGQDLSATPGQAPGPSGSNGDAARNEAGGLEDAATFCGVSLAAAAATALAAAAAAHSALWETY